MTRVFDRLTAWVARRCGGVGAMALFLACVGAWLAWGVLRGFSDGMMAWMGAVSGIVSIALLIVLQNTQARGDTAIQTKLDALVRVSEASNELIGIEAREAVEIEAARLRVTLEEG